MAASCTTGKTFTQQDYTTEPLSGGEYENCHFLGCQFGHADLAKLIFVDCSFRDCDLSMANLDRTAFREVEFVGCKMLGMRFDRCNEFLFEASFQHCTLDLSSFYRRRLKKTQFRHCSLVECDFSESDLTEAVFDQCDLTLAVFDQTLLEKADLRTAFGYAIDPENNRIRKARFTWPGIAGLLHRYDIVVDA